MRRSILVAILVTCISASSRNVGVAQVSTSRHGSTAATIGGAALGAFSGAVIGSGGFRGLCRDRHQVCWPPLLAGLALGAAAGTYAGATDTERIRGATIGLGAGALGGLVITSLLISSEVIKPQGEWQPLGDLFAGAMIGAAAGSILGGLLTSAEDPNANHPAIIALHLSF